MGLEIGKPRLSRDQVLLATAKLYALRSTCARQHTGAIVARDGRILTTGYNGAPVGMAHCMHPDPTSTKPEDACRISVHAELNAIAFAARCGVALEGAELFCTHMPCVACTQGIINAGIKRVVYETPYRDRMGLFMLEQVGIEYMQLSSSVVIG